jgi:predicted AlkP superfamily phosphohydrolase/phosphomutase
MASPIIFIGLDACDPATVQELCRAGRLPNLQRLRASGARARVKNPFGLFVGSTWMNFATTRNPSHHRFHCWDEIEVATYERVLTSPIRHSLTPFWQTLSDAGRRIAVIDVPHTRAGTEINGIELSEWGCHDRHFGLRSWPPQRGSELAAEYGLHPIFGEDAYAQREFAPDDYVLRADRHRTTDEEIAMTRGLLDGLTAKRRMNAEHLAQGGWDLFMSVFGESHAVGHQQWHLHDSEHPRFDANARERMGFDPLHKVYEELDGAVGDALALGGRDATVMVLLSHGMGPHFDGTHLLDEILTRLDAAEGATVSPALAALWRGSSYIPGRLQRKASSFAVPFLRRAIAGAKMLPASEYATADARRRQRFFMEPNNYVYGGVRFNVAGRESHGTVTRDQVPGVAKRLERDLLAIVNVATGEPVIKGVHWADAHYTRADDDTMPDLFIEWARTGLVETVWSPKIGLVHAPYTHWRTGDHHPDGLLLAAGPTIPRGRMHDVAIEDLGVNIARRLGVSSGETDGHVAPWLAGD